MWFFIFCSFMARAGKLESSSCPLQTSPLSAAVQIGDPLSATCDSLSNQTEGMGWESSNGGVSLTSGVSTLPLKIDSVTDWRLEPTCFINLKTGSQCLLVLPVVVYKEPDNMTLSQLDQTGPMVQGNTYRMQCDVVNVAPVARLTIVWHRGGERELRHFNDTSPYPSNTSSVFTMTAQKDDNGNRVSCEALLDVPNLSPIRVESQRLTVLYPPSFIVPLNETLKLPPGGEVVLNCTATGNPSPTYSWHFPHPVQLENKDLNTNQPILTPSFQFAGTYNCTVSNSLGSVTKYFTVIQAAGDRSTFAALVGGLSALGVVVFIAGLFLLTENGTFSCSKVNYLRGRPV